ncbi:MAG: ribosome hibernation-promoting factor, HPF/YfiA family [Planctomycetota bacterium]
MSQEVQIDIVNRHGHVSSKMQDYAEKKAERLLRFHGRISRIEVIVDGPHEAPEVEMIVHLDGSNNLFAKETSNHFNSAMDQMTDKMERQLVKANQKRKQHKGDKPLGEVVLDNTPPAPEESFDDAMRKKLDS